MSLKIKSKYRDYNHKSVVYVRVETTSSVRRNMSFRYNKLAASDVFIIKEKNFTDAISSVSHKTISSRERKRWRKMKRIPPRICFIPVRLFEITKRKKRNFMTFYNLSGAFKLVINVCFIFMTFSDKTFNC